MTKNNENTIIDWVVRTTRSHVMAGIGEITNLHRQMLFGDQTRTVREGKPVDITSNRGSVVVRNIFPEMLRAFTAKLLKDMPIPHVTPYGKDWSYESYRASKIANAVMSKLVVDLDLEKKMEQIVYDYFLGHLGVMLTYFDQDSGDIDKTTTSLAALYGDTVDRHTKIKQGEAKAMVIPPQHYFYDTTASDDPDRRYVILKFTLPRTSVKRQFSESKMVDQAPDAFSGVDAVGFGPSSPLTTSPTMGHVGHNDGDRLISVYEVFAVPGGIEGHPDGYHAILTDNEILFEEDWDKGIPVHTFAPGRISNQYLPPCPATSLREHQVRLNRAESMVEENMMYSGNNQWVADRKTNFRPHNHPGIPSYYDAPSGIPAPKNVTASAYPAYIIMRGEAIKSGAMAEIGINPTSQGDLSGLQAGAPTSMVVFAREMEDELLSAAVREVERFYREISKALFRLVADNYSDKREIFVTSDTDSRTKNREYFKGADFDGQMEFQIKAGINIGSSSIQRFESAKLFMLQGQMSFNDFLEAERFSYNLDFLRNRRLKDRDRAYRNRDRVIKAAEAIETVDSEPEVAEQAFSEFVLSLLTKYDNHRIHIDVFKEYFISEAGDESGPIVRNAILGYMDAAEAFQQQVAQENASLAAAAGMGPGVPGQNAPGVVSPGGGPQAAEGSPAQFEQATTPLGSNPV